MQQSLAERQDRASGKSHSPHRDSDYRSNKNSSVKSTRSQQCAVNKIGSIGRTNYQHAVARRHAIHFGEQRRQQSLLHLVSAVGACLTCTY
jgi:hypothetical protein